MKAMIKPLNFTSLRTLSIFVMVCIACFLTITYIFSYSISSSLIKYESTNGYADLTGYEFEQNKPVYLDGEWEHYDNIFIQENAFDKSLLTNGKTVNLPYGSITEAKGTATYRLQLKLDQDISSQLMLYIPNSKTAINIFVNGQYQQPYMHNNSSGHPSLFMVSGLDASREWQEIVISTNEDPNETAFFKRQISIGTLESIMSITITNLINEVLQLGMLLLILTNGYIFMFFMPGHKLMSLITIFDTLLILRIIFNMGGIVNFFSNGTSSMHITDEFVTSCQLLLLLISGIIGSVLAQALFDKDHKVPKKISQIIPLAYLIMAFIFPFNLNLFDKFGVLILTIVYIITFVIIFFQFIIYWKKEHNFYAAFQIAKTIYVGVLIFYDICNFNNQTNFLNLLYLYFFFFIAHVIIRLYDSNFIYKRVEQLNQNLEGMIVERTQELSQANKILSELSIRDPLTNAFNRLHFERAIEKAINDFIPNQSNFYLCIFDLDFFKKINDNYGHNTGDDQLKFVVQAVQALLPEDSVLARIGGEEFTIIFSDFTDQQVLTKIEDIRQVLEKSAQEDPHKTTASFGITKYKAQMTIKEIMKAADKCLYYAKNNGRNQVYADFQEVKPNK